MHKKQEVLADTVDIKTAPGQSDHSSVRVWLVKLTAGSTDNAVSRLAKKLADF
jgi:hypothetical protein